MNTRPSGYEPDELPGCSTPHQEFGTREGCPIPGMASRLFRARHAIEKQNACAQGAGGAAVGAGAVAYFAIRRPMRGTAASTCFFPVGRSFS